MSVWKSKSCYFVSKLWPAHMSKVLYYIKRWEWTEKLGCLVFESCIKKIMLILNALTLPFSLLKKNKENLSKRNIFNHYYSFKSSLSMKRTMIHYNKTFWSNNSKPKKLWVVLLWKSNFLSFISKLFWSFRIEPNNLANFRIFLLQKEFELV